MVWMDLVSGSFVCDLSSIHVDGGTRERGLTDLSLLTSETMAFLCQHPPSCPVNTDTENAVTLLYPSS